MDILEKMKAWLVTFPQWGEVSLDIDTTASEPVSCGLFPVGLEQLERREDVLGSVRAKYRWQFLLRRIAQRQEDAAQWLLAFQDWVRRQSLQGIAPTFGDVPGQERIRAEKGRLISASQTGTATYEVKIIAEFEKEN